MRVKLDQYCTTYHLLSANIFSRDHLNLLHFSIIVLLPSYILGKNGNFVLRFLLLLKRPPARPHLSSSRSDRQRIVHPITQILNPSQLKQSRQCEYQTGPHIIEQLIAAGHELLLLWTQRELARHIYLCWSKPPKPWTQQSPQFMDIYSS